MIHIHSIRKEARRLGDWRPGTPTHSQFGEVLSEFVREIEELAPQGFLVPLTDFTDRLDSIIEGLVGRLHDIANLFLIVGIAGTVWSFFEVSADFEGTAQPVEVLLEGLETAFPVAFFGFVLYFAAYVVVHGPEEALRREVAAATRRAWERRRRVARSQAKVLEEAVRPLRRLDETLAKAVDPVVQQFGERLDAVNRVTEEQIDGLRKTLGSVDESVKALTSVASDLQDASKTLEQSVTGLPSALEDVRANAEEQRKAIEQLHRLGEDVHHRVGESLENWEGLHRAFSDVLDTLRKLPQGVTETVTTTLTAVAQDLPEVWRGATAGLREEITNIVRGVDQASTRAEKSVTDAARGWNDVATSARQWFKDVFAEGAEQMREIARQELPQIEEVFVKRFPTALASIRSTSDELMELAGRLEDLKKALGPLIESVGSGPTWTSHLAAMRDDVRRLVDVVGRWERERASSAHRKPSRRRTSLIGRLFGRGDRDG